MNQVAITLLALLTLTGCSKNTPRSPLATYVPLDVQEKCAADAARFVKNLKEEREPFFRSHFNNDLGRCLVATSLTGGSVFDMVHLVADANSQESIGVFRTWTNKSEKLPAESRFIDATGKLKDNCTEVEYHEFEGKIMEWQTLFRKAN